jgi:hypothetical protein
MKENEINCELLLGGIWYPWHSIEAEKQIELARCHAKHLTKRATIFICDHIEGGLKSCPRKWKKEKILKYIQDFKDIKINKNNVIDIIKR